MLCCFGQQWCDPDAAGEEIVHESGFFKPSFFEFFFLEPDPLVQALKAYSYFVLLCNRWTSDGDRGKDRGIEVRHNRPDSPSHNLRLNTGLRVDKSKPVTIDFVNGQSSQQATCAAQPSKMIFLNGHAARQVPPARKNQVVGLNAMPRKSRRFSLIDPSDTFNRQLTIDHVLRHDHRNAIKHVLVRMEL